MLDAGTVVAEMVDRGEGFGAGEEDTVDGCGGEDKDKCYAEEDFLLAWPPLKGFLIEAIAKTGWVLVKLGYSFSNSDFISVISFLLSSKSGDVVLWKSEPVV
jgi:hypothetical protein